MDHANTLAEAQNYALNEPIDVVYTWVDSEDPQWKREYAAALEQYGSASPRTASDIVRFQDREELKYSLRSLEMFAPWVNHIYIVTNGQVPGWLDTSNTRVTVVTHKQIFENPEDLPTFNSHAIEANLHRIPGLKEHFLYFNDDVFLADWCTPKTFFTNEGLSKFFESENKVPDDPSVTDLPSNWAAYNIKRMLQDRFNYKVTHKFKHTAHAQRLSTLKRAAKDFRTSLSETSRQKFRQRTDVALPSNLAHHFGAIVGTATSAQINYRYIDISSPRAEIELSRLLLWDQPTIFCLNQVASKKSPAADDELMIKNFLERYFPWKSSAEL
ncbi:stealth conserved region 3 domain-containing protein [Arthrobacter sp. MYb227]|uniref:stealth conserved region 3 domain-containing protein n=1 Tax=Arthrobacter sp. MYb227 TaxID=1848601 RepID=UPI0015E43CBE|nr:stealth conserved region 3 domain-containing protein [Arthrobacter sp. MYb227]